MKRMLMRKPVSKMAGLTLLETMFGIAIGALILIAAVIFYTSTKNSQNTSKVVTDLNSIVAQTSSYIAPGGTSLTNLTSATTAPGSIGVLQGAGYLPSPMNDPWGTAYSAIVTAGAAGVPATTTITVAGAGAPTTATCKAIVQATAPGGTGVGTDSCDIKFTL
jgi:type II secretory pathway pseudopilin PulG